MTYAVYLEDHVSERFTSKHVTADEFGQDVDLVCIDVRDTLNQGTWDEIDSGDNQGEGNAVYRQIRVVDLNHDT